VDAVFSIHGAPASSLSLDRVGQPDRAMVLLLWPIAPDTPLWDMPGVFGGGRPGVESADVITPIGALISGESVGDGGDRLQLAGGLFLRGLAVGAGLRSGHRRRM